jgi:hypothetical protein
MSETWGRAFFRAVVISAWLVALVVVTIAVAWQTSDWRLNAQEFHANMDPRLRPPDEMFPNSGETEAAAAERVASARSGLADITRDYAVSMSIWGAIGLGLVAAPFIYRRRVPRERRPTRRTWLLFVPSLVLVTLPLLYVVATAFKGALRD